ncbi:uncharacterized protein SOCE26_080810 [Sorangium cellulosum]|uniref:Uncharacterized protein n=1 Tax=Sorangium cellulosum TaxID=56 RepID=A0A2L0F4S9_SORCE|nr:uncharacterized protein SOCE26_080810 [Sorangium cellulosum]
MTAVRRGRPGLRSLPEIRSRSAQAARRGTRRLAGLRWSTAHGRLADSCCGVDSVAAIAAARGCDPQSFTNAAFAAYVAKNPAFRRWLETAQLAHQLEHLRREGRIGVA